VAADLAHPKARSLAALLAARDDIGADLLEIRKSATHEWLIISVPVEVGQCPSSRSTAMRGSRSGSRPLTWTSLHEEVPVDAQQRLDPAKLPDLFGACG